MTKREMTIEEAIEIFKEVREEVIAKETELSKQVFENLGLKAVELAIKELEQQSHKDYLKKRDKDYVHYNVKWLLDNWEQELELLSGGKIKPCEDCISRESVIRLVEQYPNIIGNRCSGLIADIKHLPPVTPTRPKGKWSRPSVVAMPYSFAYECPICRQWGNIQTFKPNYCPNCGAEMEIENEKEIC